MFLATYQISSLEAKLMICQFRGDGTEYVDLVSLDFHARGILSAYIANHFSHSVGIRLGLWKFFSSPKNN
jgi:hypothetical protein